jgi:CRP-like cAMP-binding protein/uncharacterized protein (DUF2249 family)
MMTQEPLDLRRLSVWERAALVLERVDSLADAESFTFYTEVNPRALMGRLEQLRPGQLAFEARHVGEAEWHVAVSRVAPFDGISTVAVALERSSAFSRLSQETRAQVAAAMVEREAKKGEVLCAENSPSDTLGLLLDGALAVVVGAGARERSLFHLFPFDTFGDTEFFDLGLAMGRTIVLSKTARYATVPVQRLRELGEQQPAFLLAMGAIVAQRNRTLASALAAQVSQPIIARVAAALLPYAAPERGLHPALAPLPTMTQAQVAASAGTVKEVAARAIAELERVQALRRERGHIRYLDRTQLLEMIDRS